jgi:hypothetical protein
MDGFYYLHENGDLIFKRTRPEADSDFVRRVWPLDVTDRSTAWNIILESIAMGAKLSRIRELSINWRCDLLDLPEYLARISNPSDLQRAGLVEYLNCVARVDYDKWMDWLAATPKGHKPDFISMPESVEA